MTTRPIDVLEIHRDAVTLPPSSSLNVQPNFLTQKLSVDSTFRSIYSLIGILMTALINNPKDVKYVRHLSARVYESMACLMTRWSEIGHQLIWIQVRIAHVRDIMVAADACLQSTITFDNYLTLSRCHMDLCSRGGVCPTKPPGC